MKKTILAIALAAVAFVGCQKEEKGMVSINLSGENYVSADKQAFYGVADQVFFSVGDGVYLNGGLCPVDLRDDAPIVARDVNDEVAASPRANLSVLAEYMHAPALTLYPASIFTPGAPFDGTTTDISDWTVTMKGEQSLINAGIRTGIVDELTNGGVADKPVWPMIAQTPSLNNHVQLKNCVALLTPAVQYGFNFVYTLAQNSVITETIDPENLPVFMADSVIISSNTNVLAGQGHIDLNTIQAGYPVLVMDEDADACYRIACKVVNEYNEDGFEVNPSINYINLGHVPVAPYVNGGDIQVALYFTLTFTDENDNETVYYCKYQGNSVENPTIIRSERSTLRFDCFTPNAVNNNKVTVSTTPLN